LDAKGDLIVADYTSIRRVTTAGVVTTIAGLTAQIGKTDGTGSTARLMIREAWRVATDGAGNVYVSDSENDTIRKVTPSGVVTTLAGLAHHGFTELTEAPVQLRASSGRRASRWTPPATSTWRTTATTRSARSRPGLVTTIAGVAAMLGNQNGTGAGALFDSPTALAIDVTDNLFVLDQNHLIRKITPAAVVTTFAGPTELGKDSDDGVGRSFSSLSTPRVTSSSTTGPTTRFA
jgi:hypothetical protein